MFDGEHLLTRHPYVTHERPLVFGHRGAAGLAPENTMASFQLALDAGVDGLELDIHPSSEDVPMVFHDDTLERCTNGRGPIRALPLAALRELDCGHTFTPDGGKTHPFRGKGERIPTLEEVFAAAPTQRINIDFKSSSPGMMDQVDQLIRKFNAHHRVLVCSSDDALAPLVRKRFPNLPTSACTHEVAKLVLLGFLGLGRWFVPAVQALQIPMDHFGIPVLTPRLIRQAHERGLDVHVWTINDEPTMRKCIELGVDGVMSDFPADLVRVMRACGKR